MRLIDADALVERLNDFSVRNYEPPYDLGDISELKWPIKREQKNAAWMKVLRRVIRKGKNFRRYAKRVFRKFAR